MLRELMTVLNFSLITRKYPPSVASENRAVFPTEILLNDSDKIGFNVNITGIKENKKYLDAVLKEIKLIGEMQSKKIDVEFFSIQGDVYDVSENIDTLLNEVEKYFVIKQEIIVPIDLNKFLQGKIRFENLHALKNKGVKRVNFTGNDFYKHKKSDLENLKKNLKECNFENINFLLSVGIVDQKFDDVVNDIDIAFDLGANSFSIFPGSVKNFKERKIFLKKILNHAKEKGYKRYKNYLFVKNDKELEKLYDCDVNLNCGVNVGSFIRSEKIFNETSIDKYIEALDNNRLPIKSYCKCSYREEMYDFAFRNITNLSLNKEEFEDNFNVSIKKAFYFTIMWCKLRGFIKEDTENLYITDKGLVHFNTII